MQENANPADNADAYLWGLTHYCAKRCYFEAKLPYEHSALGERIFNHCYIVAILIVFVLPVVSEVPPVINILSPVFKFKVFFAICFAV